MGLVEVDTGNPDLFKPYEFKVLPAGKHLLEVANDLVVAAAAPPSPNSVVKVELRCQDEDENKGTVVWENFTIIAAPQSEKERTSQKINQGRLAQFAVACGVKTQAEIEGGSGIPLEPFKGARCDAITRVESYKDPNTQESKTRAKVGRYLFAAE